MLEEYYHNKLYAGPVNNKKTEKMLDSMLMAIGILKFDFHEFNKNLKKMS